MEEKERQKRKRWTRDDEDLLTDLVIKHGSVDAVLKNAAVLEQIKNSLKGDYEIDAHIKPKIKDWLSPKLPEENRRKVKKRKKRESKEPVTTEDEKEEEDKQSRPTPNTLKKRKTKESKESVTEDEDEDGDGDGVEDEQNCTKLRKQKSTRLKSKLKSVTMEENDILGDFSLIGEEQWRERFNNQEVENSTLGDQVIEWCLATSDFTHIICGLFGALSTQVESLTQDAYNGEVERVLASVLHHELTRVAAMNSMLTFILDDKREAKSAFFFLVRELITQMHIESDEALLAFVGHVVQSHYATFLLPHHLNALLGKLIAAANKSNRQGIARAVLAHANSIKLGQKFANPFDPPYQMDNSSLVQFLTTLHTRLTKRVSDFSISAARRPLFSIIVRGDASLPAEPIVSWDHWSLELEIVLVLFPCYEQMIVVAFLCRDSATAIFGAPSGSEHFVQSMAAKSLPNLACLAVMSKRPTLWTLPEPSSSKQAKFFLQYILQGGLYDSFQKEWKASAAAITICEDVEESVHAEKDINKNDESEVNLLAVFLVFSEAFVSANFSSSSQPSPRLQLDWIPSILKDAVFSNKDDILLESVFSRKDEDIVGKFGNLQNCEVKVSDVRRCYQNPQPPGMASWLTCRVIDVFREIWQPVSIDYILQFNFYEKLTSDGSDYVHKWFTGKRLQKKIFDFERLFVITNPHNIHYNLYEIKISHKLIILYDSNDPDEELVQRVYTNLVTYLQFASTAEQVSFKFGQRPEWKLEYAKVPKQKNSHDCGVYMLKFLEFRLNNIEVVAFPENMSSMMQSYRKHFAISLCNCSS